MGTPSVASRHLPLRGGFLVGNCVFGKSNTIAITPNLSPKQKSKPKRLRKCASPLREVARSDGGGSHMDAPLWQAQSHREGF